MREEDEAIMGTKWKKEGEENHYYLLKTNKWEKKEMCKYYG